MKEITSNRQTLLISMNHEPETAAVQRLLVLIPDMDADLTPVASRAWEIARESGARVKFISLFEDTEREPGLRRKLATLSALVTDGRVRGEAEVMRGRDWVGAVRSRWQPGDMLVCMAEQRAGPMLKPLSQILESDLKVPLTILSGLTPAVENRPRWYEHLAAWAGLLGIVVSFCLLQVRIHQTAGEWTTVLMIVSLGVEYLLIWLWNSLF